MKKQPRIPRRSFDHSCADAAFVADLGFQDTSPQAEAALAVRRVLARTAEVPAESISASCSFADDLAGRGIFDGSLDTVEFVMMLEEELQTDIPNFAAERFVEINSLDLPHPLYTVADFTLSLVEKLMMHQILANA